MTPSAQICIVPRTAALGLSEASAVAAAIQGQILSDFFPIWQISAVVGAAPDPLPGCIPVFVYDNIGQSGVAGYHATQSGAFAYAMVDYGPGWSITASHEILEILVDPTANRTWSGVLPPPNPRQVAFLYEICDPCQSPNYAYLSGGFYVSDFYTPAYCSGAAPVSGTAYSFRRNLQQPMSVLPGGTLSWIDVDDNLYQAFNDGQQISLQNLGPFNGGPQPMREFVGRFDKGYSLIVNDIEASDGPTRGELLKTAFVDAARIHSERFNRDIAPRLKTSRC